MFLFTITIAGRALLAKAQQGKIYELTRVAIGDGLIGSGSLVTKTALISEKLSMEIDAAYVINETDSAVISTLTNAAVAEEFAYREIAVFGRDPDTAAEVAAYYGHAGDGDCETIPAAASSESVYERLKLIISTSGVTEITFDSSGNPLFLTVEDVPTVPVTFTQAEDRTNLSTGETLAVLFGKIKKWFADLGTAAFTDSSAYATAVQGTKADGAIQATAKGAANGVAELDSGGKVPSAQLPSYVDDVLGYDNLAAFPATGESGKIYVAHDTNITYRWSGSAYVEISASLALGETSATAYRGDRGKTAYDHSQTVTGNPHNVLASQISDFLSGVRAAVLTGLSTATSAVITAADTVLSALGKLQAQITALPEPMYKKIRDIADASGSTISIDVSDIDWDVWREIRIIGSLTQSAAATVPAYARINSLSGSNYNRYVVKSDGSASNQGISYIFDTKNLNTTEPLQFDVSIFSKKTGSSTRRYGGRVNWLYGGDWEYGVVSPITCVWEYEESLSALNSFTINRYDGTNLIVLTNASLWGIRR